ncbi:MAG: hypothetical protein II600_01005, partial [Bacteroidaceae bacterium]|nr:hypothetical protein [Bacteroidaceae bacterium]
KDTTFIQKRGKKNFYQNNTRFTTRHHLFPHFIPSFPFLSGFPIFSESHKLIYPEPVVLWLASLMSQGKGRCISTPASTIL